MPKAGERSYFSAIPPEGRVHAENKPFSAWNCDEILLELGMIRRLLPAPPARLLDLGCGTGWTTCFYARMGYRVVGQDIAPDMIESALANRARNQAESAEFILSDFEGMDFENEFDAAVFYDCLHHAEDEKEALAAVYRALVPGGVCIACEPGVGHAAAEHSRHAMEAYGVTEKDMPAEHVISLAKALGFADAWHFPRPVKLVDALIQERTHKSRRRWLPPRPDRLSTAAARRLRRAVEKSRRRGGIVLLVK